MSCEHKWRYFESQGEDITCLYRQCMHCQFTQARGHEASSRQWWKTKKQYLVAALLEGNAKEIKQMAMKRAIWKGAPLA